MKGGLMYIVWMKSDSEGWERNDAQTIDDAVRIRNRQLSIGEGEIVVTELVTDLGAEGVDKEIWALAQIKKALHDVDTKAAFRIAHWILEYAKDGSA
jgi:hypothetical protein